MTHTLTRDQPLSSQSAEGQTTRKTHLPGLDSLRFIAAMFVVIGHIPLNQTSVGLPVYSTGTFFYRGSTAVSFFFALSGFLISYLLLDEHRATGTVNVARFYLRRVCRIWPVYFVVVLFGLLFYNWILPALNVDYPVEYSPLVALGLYVFFLPNLMNSLYTVGGILNPSWSIGVEEQFYLAWAPAFRRFSHRFGTLCWTVLLLSGTLFVANTYGLFGSGWESRFIFQLRFHYMAAGGLCAWWLHTRGERFTDLSVFRSRWLQGALFLLLADYYLVSFVPWSVIGGEAMQLVLYPWLIVCVAANPRNVIRLDNRLFDYFGKISYGIYMFHMIVVYATSALFLKTSWWRGHEGLYFVAYYVLAVGGTLLVAHLSFLYFERPFLKLKDRRFGSGRDRKATPPPGVGELLDEAPGLAVDPVRSAGS